jgi:hypothetical protein
VSLVSEGSRDSSVGIATGYELDSKRIRSSSPGRIKNFFHFVETGSGAHRASFPVYAGVSFPGCEADRSSPASSEVKKMWIYTSIPPYVFMA